MTIKRHGKPPRRRAFTLLEVLMVVVIIGLLAAFVAPQFFKTGDRAKRDLAKAAVESGLGVLDLYRMHLGSYPSSDDGGLELLLKAPDDEEVAKKWEGPYVKKAQNLNDPWDHPYIYVFPGEVNESGYDLSSAGPDGQEGTDDDIVNWTKT